MKGTQSMRFGVLDVRLGGVIVGVVKEHSGNSVGGDAESTSRTGESKRPMTPGVGHVREAG